MNRLDTLILEEFKVIAEYDGGLYEDLLLHATRNVIRAVLKDSALLAQIYTEST